MFTTIRISSVSNLLSKVFKSRFEHFQKTALTAS